MKRLLPLFLVAGLVGCDQIDTSALQEIEETAAAARTTAETINARSAEIQAAVEDPVGTLRGAALGATFTKTETPEAGIFVLTDVQTGCQWLATYGADGTATSMEPRTEMLEGVQRQRCLIRTSTPSSAPPEEAG